MGKRSWIQQGAKVCDFHFDRIRFERFVLFISFLSEKGSEKNNISILSFSDEFVGVALNCIMLEYETIANKVSEPRYSVIPYPEKGQRGSPRFLKSLDG